MVLYIFMDESGNFDFSIRQGATEWLTLTSLSTTTPEEGIEQFYKVKHELMRSGYDQFCFHATEDRQAVRDRVFGVIASLTSARIDGLAIRKRRLYPAWRPQQTFYPKMIRYLLQYVFHPYGLGVKFEHIIVVLAKMQLPKGQKDALLGGFQRFLRWNLGSVPFSLLLHPGLSHPYLQMVDYCCWALHIRRERNEERPFHQISQLVKSDFDIFERGYKDWY